MKAANSFLIEVEYKSHKEGTFKIYMFDCKTQDNFDIVKNFKIQLGTSRTFRCDPYGGARYIEFDDIEELLSHERLIRRVCSEEDLPVRSMKQKQSNKMLNSFKEYIKLKGHENFENGYYIIKNILENRKISIEAVNEYNVIKNKTRKPRTPKNKC
jgi:hypothetical protein